jgi:hypothetical protein
MKKLEPQLGDTVNLPSSIMRAPYVFEKYGSVEGLVRDIVIWIAWNEAPEARLNLRQFAKMFGYTDAYLFKKVNPDQKAWLKLNNFGPEFKDVIGYALAKMSVDLMNFPRKAAFVARPEGSEEWVEYQTLPIIYSLTSQTSRLGTNYWFKVHELFLSCITGEKERLRYQTFFLTEYLELRSASGKAWAAGRRMFMHLAWKRGVWKAAAAKDKRKHETGQLDEIERVANFKHADPRRTVWETKELMKKLKDLNSVQVLGTLEYSLETETYKVKFDYAKQLQES